MYLTLVLFVVGMLVTSQLPWLPAQSTLIWLVLALPVSLLKARTRPLVGLLIGITYSIYSAHVWLDHKIPINLEGEPVAITGLITEMPIKTQTGWRIQVEVEQGELKSRLLSLGWYEEVAPVAGDLWHLVVKLQRPRGTVNPGLFDYEAWLLSNRIHGTGYVIPGMGYLKLRQFGVAGLFEQSRQQLTDKLLVEMEEHPVRGMLVALLVGDSSQLSGSTWQTLSATGTNHLLIVSGLHVSLVVALVFWLLRSLNLPRGFAVSLSIFSAVVYSLMTGFGLPVQRALMMSTTGLLILTAKRQTPVWHALLLALAGVLVMNPFASLAAGFWLSFAAVAGLLFAFQGQRADGMAWLAMLLRSQWVALLVTAPLLLCWVYKFSVMSLLANLIAVPVVSLLVVPALLLVLVTWRIGLEAIADLLVTFTYWILSMLYQLLLTLANFDWVIEQPLDLGWILLLAVFGSILLLLPAISLPRWIGVLCWLPALSPLSQSLAGTRLTLLDVGQGLSVLIQTSQTSLLYDAGPAIGRFDAGERIVVPTLRQNGASQLDLLVVSHGDNDHAGGASAVQQSVPIQEQLTGPCFERRVWQFDDLFAEVLPSSRASSDSRNDLSCVLFVRTTEASILLPGDIEFSAEANLLKSNLGNVDLLVAPHHGSRSSSTPSFINRMAPKWVLFATGYRNRFGHPHAEVVARYLNRGVRVFDTANSGALSIHFHTDGRVEVFEARRTSRRFWYDAPTLPGRIGSRHQSDVINNR